MSISDDIATIRKDAHSKGRRGLRDVDRRAAYMAAQVDGIWDALETLAKAIDEKRD